MFNAFCIFMNMIGCLDTPTEGKYWLNGQSVAELTDDQLAEAKALIAEFSDVFDDTNLAGRIVGVEALVRWNHPTRGIMRPDDFIPLAESTGLISPITWFVVDRSLRQVREWNARGIDMSMAINLSVRHLTDMSLPDRIAIALSRWDVAPDRLVIEVTGSSVIRWGERVPMV